MSEESWERSSLLCQWSHEKMVPSPAAAGLCSLFINQNTATALHWLWSIGYAFFVVSQLNSHYREWGRLAYPAHFYLSEITMCLILSHSDPKATAPAGVCSPGLVPRHTAQQDLEIAQHFLMADPSFSSNPHNKTLVKIFYIILY